MQSYHRVTNIKSKDSRKIVVEFSSPNICKPFHAGHLRSTIIGNFISNLYEYLNNDVIRLNYLGDWGTQFGFLKVGLELGNVLENEIKANPIQTLYNAYVNANKLNETQSSVGDRAREIFARLEKGDEETIKYWEKWRGYTLAELTKIYGRLGIKFDYYHWESMYGRKSISEVINILELKGLIINQADGKKVIEVKGNRKVPIMKSDETTLYLTRDLAALIDRYEKYNFEKIIYVVDNGQNDHFTSLFDIAHQLNPVCFDGRLTHVKFGRVKGMSTRKGNVIFLKDILDEAKFIMQQKQLYSPTTKIDLYNDSDEIADILGISAVIINDLKQRRHRDYDFDWEKALQINGDSGIKLQYTHCRLWNLELNLTVLPAKNLQADLLPEPEAIKVMTEIAKFGAILAKTETSLEACVLVNYLFVLCNALSRALKVLNIKNEKSEDIQSQRMLLFNKARLVLGDGMKILGLQPLKKM